MKEMNNSVELQKNGNLKPQFILKPGLPDFIRDTHENNYIVDKIYLVPNLDYTGENDYIIDKKFGELVQAKFEKLKSKYSNDTCFWVRITENPENPKRFKLIDVIEPVTDFNRDLYDRKRKDIKFRIFDIDELETFDKCNTEIKISYKVD